MIQMTVGDFKAQFSSVLEKVLQGDEVQILYGRSKKPVAQITKIEEKPKKKKRIPGLYKDYGPYWEDETFEFTPENLFDNMDDLLL
ncbi:MAG: prevent-host-death protein [Treponema sp.]|nr:prevent-host-death protein [Treponema sp.]